MTRTDVSAVGARQRPPPTIMLSSILLPGGLGRYKWCDIGRGPVQMRTGRFIVR